MLYKLIVIMILETSGISQHEYIFNTQEACIEASHIIVGKNIEEYFSAPYPHTEQPIRMKATAMCVPDPLVQS